MTEQHDILRIYDTLLHQSKPDEKYLDYSIAKKHIDNLHTLSKIGNSSISVFDFFKKEHIFYSSNFGEFFGYNLSDIEQKGQQFLDNKIHPADRIRLFQIGISVLKLFASLSIDEKINFKLINEFRILNNSNRYIRLIEQHQVLELDKLGNTWLTISFIDLSPNQEDYDGVKSQLLNFRTGKIIPFLETEKQLQIELTKREKEILKLVKEGFLSKEISDKLSISVHTVNTHRQRFLEKLGANNSLEAAVFASKLGLLT